MVSRSLVLTALSDIPDIHQSDDLVGIIWNSLVRSGIELADSDIIVIAQKIVSKAEGRYAYLPDIVPSEEAQKYAAITGKDTRLVELILRESNEVVRVKENLIIVEHRLGFICANAGIDHSNVKGPYGKQEDWVLLLPVDPDMSAERIRIGLESVSGKKLGVMIIDSHGRAWRLGTVGVVIGLSQIPGIVDFRGMEDRYGYKLRATIIGAADELAAAASLVMGQADESFPVVHVRGFPYTLRSSAIKEILRPKEMDLFR